MINILNTTTSQYQVIKSVLELYNTDDLKLLYGMLEHINSLGYFLIVHQSSKGEYLALVDTNELGKEKGFPIKETISIDLDKLKMNSEKSLNTYNAITFFWESIARKSQYNTSHKLQKEIYKVINSLKNTSAKIYTVYNFTIVTQYPAINLYLSDLLVRLSNPQLNRIFNKQLKCNTTEWLYMCRHNPLEQGVACFSTETNEKSSIFFYNSRRRLITITLKSSNTLTNNHEKENRSLVNSTGIYHRQKKEGQSPTTSKNRKTDYLTAKSIATTGILSQRHNEHRQYKGAKSSPHKLNRLFYEAASNLKI